MLHASETWPLMTPNLQRNDRGMFGQICNMKPDDIITLRSRELVGKLELENLGLILRERNREREGFAGKNMWSLPVTSAVRTT